MSTRPELKIVVSEALALPGLPGRAAEAEDGPADRPGAPPATLRARGLRKGYAGKSALCGVGLDLRAGEVLAVLGPNGAGKTTLLEICAGLRRPDAGEVLIDGEPVRGVRGAIGLLPQPPALPPYLKVEELLRLYAALHRDPWRPPELLDALGLTGKAGAYARHLSGGQQQRVALALALVGRPRVLLLDEPTSDLDPHARARVWEVVRAAAAAGCAVLVSTHQIEEAERICTRVLVLDGGRAVSEGAPAELVRRHCPGGTIRFATEPGADLAFLGAAVTRADPGRAAVWADPVEPVLERLLGARRGLVVEDVTVHRPSLADVFFALTGRALRG